MQTASTAVHRAAALDIGGFGDATLGEDLELWARMAPRYPIAHSTAVTALYLRDTGGVVELPNIRSEELTSCTDVAGATVTECRDGRVRTSNRRLLRT